MSRGDVQTWFLILFAAGMSFALVVRTLRGWRPARPIVPGDPDRDDAHRRRALGAPRPQHYAFAHVVLRDVFLEDPDGTWDKITSPGVGDFLVSLWLAAQPAGTEPLSPEGLRVDVDGPIAVITLPPPARVTEAYMIAIARDARAYFVLERGIDQPYVAEWRNDMRIRHRAVRIASKRELVDVVREVTGA